MKLYFMKQDAVDFMKHNMERLYTHYYQDDTNEWMAREYGSNPFADFMEVPDFDLAEIDAMSIGEVDFENCKILYNNLRMLSESQCSDERLWAGLCNSTFYSYMRRRYQYPSKQLKKKETDASAIISRFFFSGGVRSGFFRNGLAKCWWVGRATFDKDNDNHFAKLDIIGANDLTTKISDIFYSNTFSSNPTILAGICDSLKYFSDHGQVLDEKKHIRLAMQYMNAVGGATLLDILSREEICKIVTARIISVLKGQISDISFDDDDDEQLLEEVIEIEEQDDYYDDFVETSEIKETFDEAKYEEFYDDDDEVEKTSFIEKPEEKIQQKKLYYKVRRVVRASVDKNEERMSTNTLNWFEKSDEELDLPKPDYITYGCWVKVLDEKNRNEIIYHIPLKDDHSRTWYGIEEKMMGQNIGFKVFLAGKNYRVIDYGRDEDRTDTKVEFISRKVELDSSESNIKQNTVEAKTKDYLQDDTKSYGIISHEMNMEHDFFIWLREQRFSERVIAQFKEYIENNNLLDIKDDDELLDFIKKRLAVCPVKERTLYKYYMEYLGLKLH